MEPSQDPLPGHSLRRLTDIAREIQQSEEREYAQPEEQGTELEFRENEKDESGFVRFGDDDDDDDDDDDEVEVKNILVAVKSSAKSYRQKQEQLREKWANIHEELAWELLSFQAVDPKDSTRKLPACACPQRNCKTVECISLEGEQFFS